ncbi:hypothetical protein TNCV_2535801 [Trichonephila clavipes]|nr:hypothetical protein TNCV_2535801 [Trichonephila clavipes]
MFFEREDSTPDETNNCHDKLHSSKVQRRKEKQRRKHDACADIEEERVTVNRHARGYSNTNHDDRHVLGTWSRGLQWKHVL